MTEKGRNPFRGFVDTMSEMNRMREHWFTEPTREAQRRTHATAWVPVTDIYAKDSDLIIRCELAGILREDIEITLSSGVLTISGERRDRPENVHYYVHERHYGHFRRTMTLPEGIDQGHISASFEEGMLEVKVEGGAAAAPELHQIQIDSSSD